MSSEPTGLRERKKQRTRADITSTTISLIAEHGLAGVRIEDICEQVGIGRSTFFRYFDSKESAFVEGVHALRVDTIVAALDTRPSDESAWDALRAAMLVVASDWRSFRDDMLLEARLRDESALLRARVAASAGDLTEAITEAISPRVDGDRQRAAVMAGAYLAAVQVGYGAWITAGADDDPTPVIGRCLDMLREL